VKVVEGSQNQQSDAIPRRTRMNPQLASIRSGGFENRQLQKLDTRRLTCERSSSNGREKGIIGLRGLANEFGVTPLVEGTVAESLGLGHPW
jgi:hypothetical protein